MGLAEIAEQVLRDGGGGPLHYREITERATNAGLMTPMGRRRGPRSMQRWESTTVAVRRGGS